MNNKLRQFFKIEALAFTILYLSFILVIATYLLPINYDLRLFESSIFLFRKLVLASFFILLTVEAYSLNTDRNKIFAIVFLIFLGILLVFPQFLMLNIMFLVIYSYYRSNNSRLDIPMSYITIGYFLLYIEIIGPFAYLIILFGWIKYLKACRYRF